MYYVFYYTFFSILDLLLLCYYTFYSYTTLLNVIPQVLFLYLAHFKCILDL